jgi:hypothetical protein
MAPIKLGAVLMNIPLLEWVTIDCEIPIIIGIRPGVIRRARRAGGTAVIITAVIITAVVITATIIPIGCKWVAAHVANGSLSITLNRVYISVWSACCQICSINNDPSAG